MKTILLKKTTLKTIALLLTAILSFFVITKIAISPEFHSASIELLDEKKIVVAELSAATAATSMALSLVPGDATTPVANQIAELSSYLLIVVCAILLEKILLTLTGYITFSFLIPLACILGIIHVYKNNTFLKNLAIRFVAFGLAIFMVVPVSAKMASLIDNTLNIQQTIEYAQESVEKAETEGNWVDKLVGSTKDAFSGIKSNAEKVINKFIDAIAGLIITACIIPIAVLFVFIWLIKLIFGVDIKLPKIKRRKTEEKLEEKEELLIEA